MNQTRKSTHGRVDMKFRSNMAAIASAKRPQEGDDGTGKREEWFKVVGVDPWCLLPVGIVTTAQCVALCDVRVVR